MKTDAKCVVLVDDDKDDVAAAREVTYNMAVLDRYDHEALERKIILEDRHVVLISADADPLAAIAMALFATTKQVSRVGVLSATNSLPATMTDTPFSIHGVLVFFSNGGERGVLLAEDRPQRKERRKSCYLIAITGSPLTYTCTPPTRMAYFR